VETNLKNSSKKQVLNKEIIKYTKALFIWQLGHRGIPKKMKLPEKEYDALMMEVERVNPNTNKGYSSLVRFRDIEVVRNEINFIEFE